jgi:hypothetical protein
VGRPAGCLRTAALAPTDPVAIGLANGVRVSS